MTVVGKDGHRGTLVETSETAWETGDAIEQTARGTVFVGRGDTDSVFVWVFTCTPITIVMCKVHLIVVI